MNPTQILITILFTLITFSLIYLIASFIYETFTTQSTPSHTTRSTTSSFLTPEEIDEVITTFRNNYGWTSPEAQQKIMRGKYTSPAALQRDLEFYNQDEYIGKFEGRK